MASRTLGSLGKRPLATGIVFDLLKGFMVPKYNPCVSNGGDSNKYQPWYFAYIPKGKTKYTDWESWVLSSADRQDQINPSDAPALISDQFCAEHIFELQEFAQIISSIEKKRTDSASVPVATCFIALLNSELSDLYPGDNRAYY